MNDLADRPEARTRTPAFDELLPTRLDYCRSVRAVDPQLRIKRRDHAEVATPSIRSHQPSLVCYDDAGNRGRSSRATLNNRLVSAIAWGRPPCFRSTRRGTPVARHVEALTIPRDVEARESTRRYMSGDRQRRKRERLESLRWSASRPAGGAVPTIYEDRRARLSSRNAETGRRSRPASIWPSRQRYTSQLVRGSGGDPRAGERERFCMRRPAGLAVAQRRSMKRRCSGRGSAT